MIIQELSALKNWLRNAGEATIIGYDSETTGFLCTNGMICGHGIGFFKADGTTETVYIPVRHTEFALATSRGFTNLNPDKVAKEIYKFFRDYRGMIVGHNMKFDAGMLSKDWKQTPKEAYKFWRNKSIADTKIFAHLIDEESGTALKPLAVRWLNDPQTEKDAIDEALKAIQVHKREPLRQSYLIEGYKRKYKPGWKEAQAIFNKQYRKNYADLDIPLCGKYCEADVRKTLNLLTVLSDRIEAEPVSIREAIKIEHELIPVIVSMELQGMGVDSDYFHKLEIDMLAEIEQLQQSLSFIAPDHELTPTGTAGFLLANKVKLPTTDKGNYCTDKGTLKWIMESTQNETVNAYCTLLLRLRKVEKLISTYIQPILQYAQFCGGSIHASYNAWATVTGRFSCSEPNLQNLPKKDKTIRNGFIPRPGFVLIAIDYDQMEMRETQILTGCPVLKDLFDKGLDPYKYMASIGESVAYEDVDPEVRGAYKTIVLQTLYGSGEARLLQATPHASKILKVFFEAFKAVGVYNRKLQIQVKHGQPIKMIGGRMRHLRYDDNYKAFNSQNQGSCAMICKRVMRREAEFLMNYQSRMIGQVHDELVFEVHETELHIVPELTRRMSDFKFSTKLTASPEIGCPSWGSKKPFKQEEYK